MIGRAVLIVSLALRDLRRDWVHLLCNAAVLASILVPLLVLFGVRNGVYDALLGQLLRNPATLQIDTRGNQHFTPDQAQEIRAWPEVAFVTLKTRSLFDYVNIRPQGGRQIRDALAVPSGAGDPMLAPLADLPGDAVAISAALAQQLGLRPGDRIELVTQAAERPRQLALARQVAAVLPEDRLAGRSVLAPLATLDLLEAFYDEYALPEYGITAGRPLADRVPAYAGMRVFARDLESLAPLQDRLESRFGIATEAQTARVGAVLGLGRNLGLALALAAGVAALGLAAALVFGFWAEVARKRRMIAHLGLLGLGPWSVGLVPMIQALVTAGLGLLLSFGLFALAARLAERLFDTGLVAGGRLVVLSGAQGLVIALAVTVFVALSALVAAFSAMATDPADVLREAG